MVVKCRVFPPICQSEEADKPLCFLHHLSVPLLCSSLLSMAACLLISALNHLCETEQREKGFFSPCISSLLSLQHSFLFLLWSLTFIFFPSSPSTPTSFKPWVFALFYSRFFLCLTVELYFQLKPLESLQMSATRRWNGCLPAAQMHLPLLAMSLLCEVIRMGSGIMQKQSGEYTMKRPQRGC